MSEKKLINILLIGLLIVFGMQLLSRVSSAIGSRIAQPALHKIGAFAFPLESESFFRYGYNSMNKSKKTGTRQNPPEPKAAPDQKTGNSAATGSDESITAFNRAIFINMLYYKAQFYLGKTYLLHEAPGRAFITKGAACLRRAVLLQGGRDTVMSTHALFLMLNHWPHLSDEDKRLCGRLIKKNITEMDLNSFEDMLKRWEAHCGEVSLFKGVLRRAPQFFNPVADSLARKELDAKLRKIYKLNHEIYSINEINNQFMELSNQNPNLLEKLKTMYRQLKQDIEGYYLLIPHNNFKEQFYLALIKRINFQILRYCFSTWAWEKQTDQRDQLETFITNCIDDLDNSRNLEELYRLLKREKYFDISDYRSDFNRGRILYKMGNYPAVISYMESLRLSIVPHTKEDIQRYSRVSLLLSDAYISSRLLLKARSLLVEMEQSTHDLMELYRQRKKIESIIGPEKKENPQKSTYYKLLENSRKIELTGSSLDTTVYIENSKDLEITLADSLKKPKASSEPGHLLKIFIDGRICHEVYIGQLIEPIILTIPNGEKFSKHNIKIRII